MLQHKGNPRGRLRRPTLRADFDSAPAHPTVRVVEGSVVDRAELMRLLASVADAMTSRIECSGLSREEKIDLRRDLSSIRPGIDGIAASQSKLPRDVDGDDDGDGEDDVADGRKVRKTRFRTRPGFKA